MNQIELHKKIDETIGIDPASAVVAQIRELIAINDDARRYFFSKVGDEWLAWLWENNFLDVIKEAPTDPSIIPYRTPELDYLTRAAEKQPDLVTRIMLSVSISATHLNPEVVDRFLWTARSLPAEQLARLALKIRDDQWPKLMAKYNRWGFEYEKMFETLSTSGAYEAVLALAEALLALRPKEELTRSVTGATAENPFYFSEMGHTRIFVRMATVSDEYAERALSLATRTMGQIVDLEEKNREDEIFNVYDSFHLFDVDFFNLNVSTDDSHISYREDVRNLAAVICVLAKRMMGEKCDDATSAKRLYDRYIKTLPDSQSMWRMRLFVMSLCPDVFKVELRQALFRVFDYENPWGLISGSEYERTLQKAFAILTPQERHDYVARVIEKFGGEESERDTDSGRDLLSAVYDHLTEEERNHAAQAFGQKLDSNFVPAPSARISRAGVIVPKAPVDLNTVSKMTIAEIVEKLKDEWSPISLRNQDTERDFFRPLSAEGMSDILRADFNTRPQEYLTSAELFFDRGKLDAHYTYSFFRGIDEALRLQKLQEMNWDGVVGLFVAITNSGLADPFDQGARARDVADVWLAGWQAVQSVMAGVIEELLKGGEKPLIDFIKHRDQLFSTIAWLMESPDPKKEEIEEADKDPRTGEPRYTSSDPFTHAINSVRGRAFNALVMFTSRNGSAFAKDAKSKMRPETKAAYEKCLAKEDTMAIMFMFGHYLAFLEYHDSAWLRSLVSQIFPNDPDKKDLYLAAWEGYLTRELYHELFVDFTELYRRAIQLNPAQYTPRRYFADLDEALANHIALAYMHFSDFDLDSDLFKLFWQTPNPERHKEFISFIGRHAVTRQNAAEWNKEHGVDIEKVRVFWDWALDHCDELDALKEFGFWMKAEDGVFESKWLAKHIVKTLEKTGGDIRWELSMMQSLPDLARIAPEDALRILRLYLAAPQIPKDNPRAWLYVNDELISIFKILYENQGTKNHTEQLINELLPRGNGQFWRLKEVLED